MSYIENIWKNVSNSIEIREIATTEKVSYQIAKIMYHDGKKDISLAQAMRISSELNSNNISLNLASNLESTLFCRIGTIYDDISRHSIYRKISAYAKRKYIAELSDYISSDYHYGRFIYNLMLKPGRTLDQAIRIFDYKVAFEMKKSGISELAAVANLLYFNDAFEAEEFANSFLNNQAIKDEPVESIKNSFFYTDKYKSKKVHGIMVVSKTEEGLKTLEHIVNMAYYEGKSQYLNKLSIEAEENKLFICDFPLEESCNESHYAYWYEGIFLKPCANIEENIKTFFHETTHFSDNMAGKGEDDHLSINNQMIANILKTIKSKQKHILKKGLSLCMFDNIRAKNYSEDPALNKKWLKQIVDNNPHASQEDIKLLLEQKIMYERKKYEVLIDCLLDIYDGLVKGKLYLIGVGGHGRKYYSNSGNVFVEFIAEIGTIYNFDGIDVLNYELGEEITKQIIEMYQKFINGTLATEDYTLKESDKMIK